jgi:hypothetical protein
MKRPQVFADCPHADAHGRLRLHGVGTVADLAQQQLVLQEDLSLPLYSEELAVDGVVQYSTDENLGVAVIDWRAIRTLGAGTMASADHRPAPRHLA